VRANVFAALVSGGNGSAGDGSERPAAGGASGGAALSRSAIAAVAFVLGGATGAALHAALAKPPPRQVVYVDRPAPLAAPASSPASSALAPPVAIASATTSAVTASRPQAGSPRVSQLAAERVLLDQARTALVEGDVARALEYVQRHRRTFVSPILGEERDAMEVEALVKAGRYEDARGRRSTWGSTTQPAT
jgi:hypothetical protein